VGCWFVRSPAFEWIGLASAVGAGDWSGIF
jgi:hypothetical protein